MLLTSIPGGYHLRLPRLVDLRPMWKPKSNSLIGTIRLPVSLSPRPPRYSVYMYIGTSGWGGVVPQLYRSWLCVFSCTYGTSTPEIWGRTQHGSTGEYVWDPKLRPRQGAAYVSAPYIRVPDTHVLERGEDRLEKCEGLNSLL